MEWAVGTYDSELVIAAESCEIVGGMLTFRQGGDVIAVFAEWLFCGISERKPGLKVVGKVVKL